jgi:Fe-S-cluster containining protein
MRSNSSHKKCVFLHNNACSIYEARPVVCRTQGLPLQLKRTDERDEEVELSLCELNFSDESHLPAQREWLDLDRLNALLAIAQQQTDLSEFSLEVLNLSSAQSQRIRLDDLRDLLLRNVN